MGFWKELGGFAKGFAEGYVSQRGVEGTLDDLSSFASKIFGSSNSNIDDEWNQTFDEIVSAVDDRQYGDAIDLLNEFYESNDLQLNFNYHYISSQIFICILEKEDKNDFNKSSIEDDFLEQFEYAKNLASDSGEHQNISELRERYKAYLQSLEVNKQKLLPEQTNTNFTSEEMEYLEEYEECLSEDGTISEKERRLLDKLASSLGISSERVQQLEQQCSSSYLSNEEREYLQEYRECISEDGTISEKERRLLDKFAKNLGLNIESVHKLESIYKQSKKSNR